MGKVAAGSTPVAFACLIVAIFLLACCCKAAGLHLSSDSKQAMEVVPMKQMVKRYFFRSVVAVLDVLAIVSAGSVAGALST